MGFKQIIHNEEIISYKIVGDEKTFKSNGIEEESITIKYYEGKASIHSDSELDVTFIVRNSLDSDLKEKKDSRLDLARSRFCRGLSVKHSRVMQPHFYTEHEDKVLLCYDKIDSFLDDNIRKDRVLKEDNGKPSELTASDIQELAMGLEEMHKNDLSFFDLKCSINYVVSKGKLKFCNNGVRQKQPQENRKDVDKNWNTTLKRNIEDFGDLLKWLLDTKTDWPEKDSFLLCFQKVDKRWCRDLRVIYTHPFLMRNEKYAIQILDDANHALVSTDDDLRNFSFLRNNVKDKNYLRRVIHKDKWYPLDDPATDSVLQKVLWYGVSDIDHTVRDDTVTDSFSSVRIVTTSDADFSAIAGESSSSVPEGTPSGTASSMLKLRTSGQREAAFGEQIGNASNEEPGPHFSAHSFRDLIRFTRNVYVHYSDYRKRINDVYVEIKKHWPTLIDAVHVASWS